MGGVWTICQVAKVEATEEASKMVARSSTGRWRRRFQTQTNETFVGAVEKGHMEMGFQVCDVKRALAAVSRIAAKGNRVSFGPEEDDNYIQNVKTGKRIKMRRKGGAYVVDVVLVGSGRKTEIAIDSAVEEPVCSKDWSQEFEMAELLKGEEMTLVSANGGKINHYGKRKVIFEAPVF